MFADEKHSVALTCPGWMDMRKRRASTAFEIRRKPRVFADEKHSVALIFHPSIPGTECRGRLAASECD